MLRNPSAFPPALVWALAFAQLVSWGIVYYSFAVFIVPMEQDLGWSRSSMMAALALGLVTAGVASPFIGAWIDRSGGRGVMVSGSVIGALMLSSWSWTSSYLVFCISWVGLGLAQAMTLYESAFAVLHRELRESAAAAIGRVTLVGGLASTAFIPLTHWLISISGWRETALILAGLTLLVCAPLYSLLPRGGSRAMSEEQAPSADAFKLAAVQPAFWGLLVTYGAGGLVFGAMTFHVVPLLLERGLSSGTVIAVVAIIGPLQVAGRLATIVLFRTASARSMGRVITALLPMSMLALIYSSGLVGAVLFATLYGVCNGITTIIRGTAAAEFLGRRNFGAINGALATPVSLAKAAAPAIAGILWAYGHSYAPVLWLLFACATVSATAFWFASSKRFQRPQFDSRLAIGSPAHD